MALRHKGGQINLITTYNTAPTGMPVLGKVESTKTVYPTDQINYCVGDDNVPIMWLNVRSVTDAIKYYAKFYPAFTLEVREQLAYDSFRRKMLAELEYRKSLCETNV